MELNKFTTESRNTMSQNLDMKSTMEILTIINNEDKKVAYAVEKQLEKISMVVEKIYKAFVNGGRLFYVGAGTSGRLGVMDSSECVPTFMISEDQVQTVMAGGADAFEYALEGAEDDEEQGAHDLLERQITYRDVVIGITA